MQWLGRKWDEVRQELIEMNADYKSRVSYPDKRIIPGGNLRVVRSNRKEGKLVFILLHDRYQKS